jgi:lipoic acid synthetase
MIHSRRIDGSQKLPPWLRRRIPLLSECGGVESIIKKYNLHTICREALCPNRAECYSKGKVTFMILGDVCTRNCCFCSVKNGVPLPPRETEPHNIARAAEELQLDYVVVTSVTRDDLEDGGAGHYARMVEELKKLEPAPFVEVLIPDLGGRMDSLEKVLASGPDVLSHNMETVRGLYGEVRKGADYDRSISVLRKTKQKDKEVMTKSSFMVGLGETREELREAMLDLREVDCDFLAVGQYLRPGRAQSPVGRYYHPAEFSEIKEEALDMGFVQVASGPLVRSSYQEVDPLNISTRFSSRENS